MSYPVEPRIPSPSGRGVVKILSINGRVKLSFEIAEYYRQYLNWKNTSADLLQDGRWWLHVVMEIETPQPSTTDEVVGVDLGIASPAVDSLPCIHKSIGFASVPPVDESRAN